MIEPNNISHLCASSLTFKTTGYKRTTSLRSTPKRHFDDTHASRVAFAQQIPATMNSTSSFYQFVPTPHEATVVNISPHLPVATVAANSKLVSGASRPASGSCSTPGEKDCTPIQRSSP